MNATIDEICISAELSNCQQCHGYDKQCIGYIPIGTNYDKTKVDAITETYQSVKNKLSVYYQKLRWEHKNRKELEK